MTTSEYLSIRDVCLSGELSDAYELLNEYFKNKNMKTITLENGKKVAISEESYKALEDAVREVTWEDVWKYFLRINNGSDNAEYLDKKTWAIRKLIITAKYLNGDWKPDWEDEEEPKWRIDIDRENKITFGWFVHSLAESIVWFKSKEAAKRAISILGEETIRAAFNTDW